MISATDKTDGYLPGRRALPGDRQTDVGFAVTR